MEDKPKSSNRRYYCTREKLEAIARVKAGERQYTVAHSMGVSRQTLGEWIAQLASADWANGVKLCVPEKDLLDRAVYTWFIQQLQAELRPTVETLLKKSSVFAARLYGNINSVNESLLQKWCSRHFINLDFKADPSPEEIKNEQAMEQMFLKFENRFNNGSESSSPENGKKTERKRNEKAEKKSVASAASSPIDNKTDKRSTGVGGAGDHKNDKKTEKTTPEKKMFKKRSKSPKSHSIKSGHPLHESLNEVNGSSPTVTNTNNNNNNNNNATSTTNSSDDKLSMDDDLDEYHSLLIKRPRRDSNGSEKENADVKRKKIDAENVNVTANNDQEQLFQVNFDLSKAIEKIILRLSPDVLLDFEVISAISERVNAIDAAVNRIDTSINSLRRFPMNFRAALLNSDDTLSPLSAKNFGSPNGKLVGSVKPRDGMHPSDIQDNLTIEYTNDVIHVGQNKLERQHLPPFGPVVRTDLKLGMQVFAAKSNTLGIWVRAKVVEIKIVNIEGVLGIVYRVRFENKKHGFNRLCPPKLLAYTEPPNVTLPVGSRVIARYKDDTGEYYSALYAGVIAEPPKSTNNLRYLVFFDDGYAQYVRHFEVYLVCSGKREVWEEIHEESKLFIKSYLKQYPERPMVKLQRGQNILTEWNGSWWNAKVTRVDGSLVEMYFDSDKRTEWIYRGSTRLAPLFNELTRTKAIGLSGKPIRRHNTMFKKKDGPYVEYTRDKENSGEEERIDSPDVVPLEENGNYERTQLRSSTAATLPQTARKHTAPNSDPRQTARKSTTQETSPVAPSQHPQHSLRRAASNSNKTIDPAKAVSQMGQIENSEIPDARRTRFAPHKCSNACVTTEDPTKHKGQNPLRIPMLCGWQREHTKQRPGNKRFILYRAPCGRRLKHIHEVAHYLHTTKSKLTVDLYCFDFFVHTFKEFRPLQILFYVKDMTYGKEPVPVCCVNSLEKENPPYLDYSSKRFPAPGVLLNTDPEFLCGCDCEDDCQNREKCQCQQLTIKASEATPLGPSLDAGYKYRKLVEPLVTGIYECNSRCKCKTSCLNRVAQNGLLARLQVFKTEQRGWGIRCLDDIPQGMFICIYAGQLLNEHMANEGGNQFGDEYQAELDHIEVVERYKEGYESDVADEDNNNSDNEDFKPTSDSSQDSSSSNNSRSVSFPKNFKMDNDSEFNVYLESQQPKMDSLFEQSPKSETGGKYSFRKRLSKDDKLKMNSLKAMSKRSTSSIENGEEETLSSNENSRSSKSIDSSSTKSAKISEKKTKSEEKQQIVCIESDDENDFKNDKLSSSFSLKHEDSKTEKNNRKLVKDSKEAVIVKNDLKEETESSSTTEKVVSKFRSSRHYFNEEYCYIMDAKNCGNIGRYLNHSCCPNVFVQNVFVDTHDLRFPWVAFFASTYIRAGTELTWDYNYDVGSVPGKIMYCHCGTSECRGRLL